MPNSAVTVVDCEVQKSKFAPDPKYTSSSYQNVNPSAGWLDVKRQASSVALQLPVLNPGAAMPEVPVAFWMPTTAFPQVHVGRLSR